MTPHHTVCLCPRPSSMLDIFSSLPCMAFQHMCREENEKGGRKMRALFFMLQTEAGGGCCCRGWQVQWGLAEARQGNNSVCFLPSHLPRARITPSWSHSRCREAWLAYRGGSAALGGAVTSSCTCACCEPGMALVADPKFQHLGCDHCWQVDTWDDLERDNIPSCKVLGVHPPENISPACKQSTELAMDSVCGGRVAQALTELQERFID